MNRRNSSIRNNKRRANVKVIYIISFLIVVFLSSIFCIKNKSYAAAEDSGRTLCYRQITVENGDSLWSIAKANYTEEWKSTKEYVKAIKEFNNMDSSDIYVGSNISIPYYTVVEAE